MNIAIYSRKSKFTGKGDSIENQVEMCRDYIGLHYPNEEHHIEVFEDEGFSGKNFNRPRFQAMMSAEHTNPFDLIVVYRLDRISRNVSDFASLIDDLNKYSTAFICIKEQFDTSTPMGRAMMNIAAVFAQLERETIAERIKDNMYMLAKDGHWLGGTTPLGYKSVKRVSGDKTYYTLDFDENQIDLVRLIFNKYREINSISGVETYLTLNGYRTQKGNLWDKSNLKRILINPIYCIGDEDSLNYFTDLGSNICFTLDDCNGENGILPYNRHIGQKRELQSPDKWIITISDHKGILTGKEWVEVQNIIKTNSKKYVGVSQERKVVNNKSLLSGVLFCSCGAYMRPKMYASGSMYYICENKMDKKLRECNQKNINGDELDKIVLEELFSFEVEDTSVNKQISALKSKIDTMEDELQNQIKRLKAQCIYNEKSIEKLTRVIMLSTENDTPMQVIEVYNKQINELLDENANLKKRITELENTDEIKTKSVTNLNNITDAIRHLKDNFDSLSIQNKREFIKKIIDRIIWDGENVNIFIKGISD